jgi:catechol 2,3-dioxygenase-like lactoylglutathione lyase family enzyme
MKLMLHHITLLVSDIQKSKRFYSEALWPLGYKLLRDKPHSAGFGIADEDGSRFLWLRVGGNTSAPRSFSCLAFSASGKKAVEEFHALAVAAGGKDNGAPGYRKYRPSYYAAYALDPDGNNIEAIWDDPDR